MNLFQDILILIIDSLGMLFLLFVILRFLLQLMRADFYNPISQAAQKITNPILIPMRRIIPGVFGIDIAAIVLAILVQMIIAEAKWFILEQSFFNPLNLFIWGILGILNICTYIAFACILIMVISSFVAPYSTNPFIMVAKQLIEPIIAPVRKVIPPAGGLDFSVMFVGIGLVIVQKIIYAAAVNTQLASGLIIGF